MASIFSRIVAGDIPSATVYEDEQTMAFMDINPASRGHTLVICKEEHPGLLEMPPELVAAVAQTVQRVARAIMDGLRPDGFNIVQNNGSAAGQIVFHYHVHIVPRWNGDKASPFARGSNADSDELQAVADIIKKHMG